MTFGPLPKVYAVDRPLHDDWPWPLSLIPRRWTGLGLPMPPKQIAGNAPLIARPVQPGYPLAPFPAGSLGLNADLPFYPDPVPPTSRWTLQAVWIGFWMPCYIAFSVMILGRRLHFNGSPLSPLAPLAALLLPGFYKLCALLMLIGCKPDVTLGDWFWWFECSLTYTKVAQ